jgi:hypothetical protein
VLLLELGLRILNTKGEKLSRQRKQHMSKLRGRKGLSSSRKEGREGGKEKGRKRGGGKREGREEEKNYSTLILMMSPYYSLE